MNANSEPMPVDRDDHVKYSQVIHALRNEMHTIVASATSMDRRDSMDQEQKKYLDLISASAQRATDQLDRLGRHFN